MEVKLRSTDVSSASESDLLALKTAKRELEAKLESLEDEVDEANARADTLQQNKARLELANQTLRQQHQKELESREEEMERVKTAMNTKVRCGGWGWCVGGREGLVGRGPTTTFGG